MDQSIAQTLIQLASSASKGTGDSASVQRLIQMSQIAEFPPRLAAQLEAQQANSQKITAQLTQTQALNAQETAKLEQQLNLKTLPPNTSFTKASFATPQGLIDIIMPDNLLQLAKQALSRYAGGQQTANLQGQQFQLVFKPGIPPSLSQLALIKQPALLNQTSAPLQNSVTSSTPIQLSNSVATNNLPSLKPGQVVQALNVVTTASQTNTAPTQNLGVQNLSAQNLGQQNLSLSASSPNTVINLKIAHFSPPSSGMMASTPQNTVLPNGQNGPPIDLSSPVNQKSPMQQGSVIAADDQGRPIIQTNRGQLLLLTGTKLEVGAKVQFQVMQNVSQADSLIPKQAFPQPEAPRGPMRIGQNWQAFESLNQLLQQEAPALLSTLQALIPSPSQNTPQRLTGLMMFFMNALQFNAGPAAFLGNPMTQALRQQNTSLKAEAILEALGRDMMNGSARVRDNLNGAEFQRFTLPMMNQDQQIQPIFFYMRPAPQGYDQGEQQAGAVTKKDEKEVRFLVDLNLSRMGPVQIDGLFKRKSMNMILRLENQLPSPIKNTIQNRYIAVMESLGLAGELQFRGAQDWVGFEDQRG